MSGLLHVASHLHPAQQITSVLPSAFPVLYYCTCSTSISASSSLACGTPFECFRFFPVPLSSSACTDTKHLIQPCYTWPPSHSHPSSQFHLFHISVSLLLTQWGWVTGLGPGPPGGCSLLLLLPTRTPILPFHLHSRAATLD